MKQFLRFQISGLTCLFWALLFFLPFINWQVLSSVKAEKAIIALVGSVTLALPLGAIIHQVSITILSPFRKWRFFTNRSVISELNTIRKNLKVTNKDSKCQNILVFAKGTKISWQENATHINKEIDIEYIRQEIDNRYSYYYVRIDNGLFAPLFAFGIFSLLKMILPTTNSTILLEQPSMCVTTIPIIALVVCILMVSYIPILFREIDDLECYLLCYENNIDAEKKE